MVEVITILIVSTIMGGCSLIFGGIGIWITVYNNFKMREREEEEEKKKEKRKNTIERKYTSTARSEHYMKISMLMHFGKSDNKKTTFLRLQGTKGELFLEVSLRKCDFKYKPIKTWYKSRGHVDPNDNAIYVAFENVTGRSRFDQYLDSLNFEELENRYWKEKEEEEEDISISEESEEDSKTNRGNYEQFMATYSVASCRNKKKDVTPKKETPPIQELKFSSSFEMKCGNYSKQEEKCGNYLKRQEELYNTLHNIAYGDSKKKNDIDWSKKTK